MRETILKTKLLQYNARNYYNTMRENQNTMREKMRETCKG